MEKLRRRNAQAKSLNRISEAESSPQDLEKNFKEQKTRKQKEMMKKKRPRTRYDRLINHFYELTKKTVQVVRDKIF